MVKILLLYRSFFTCKEMCRCLLSVFELWLCLDYRVSYCLLVQLPQDFIWKFLRTGKHCRRYRILFIHILHIRKLWFLHDCNLCVRALRFIWGKDFREATALHIVLAFMDWSVIAAPQYHVIATTRYATYYVIQSLFSHWQGNASIGMLPVICISFFQLAIIYKVYTQLRQTDQVCHIRLNLNSFIDVQWSVTVSCNRLAQKNISPVFTCLVTIEKVLKFCTQSTLFMSMHEDKFF